MRTSSSSKDGPARQLTAVATMGEKGQAFTVFEKNWFCPQCKGENYATQQRCHRCKMRRPASLEREYVQDPALQAIQQGEENPWKEFIDANTKQVYYYNQVTGITQWDRPLEMGQAPMATGWFGRGQAGSSVALQYAERNARYIARPAKKQKDMIDPKKYHTEGANEYNIWYDKYVGDTARNKEANKEPAPDRCKVEEDAGATKADRTGNPSHFCLHFARGYCARGTDCTYFHRIPLPADDARCDEMYDCFGRQRHSHHRDDMKGVGSFLNPSRTLFVGGLNKASYDSPKALEDTLWKHFSEWGELENVNVIHRLSIAFPRYRLRTSAEFAKEAMSNQALDHKEILSIRWAKDDPNPTARAAIDRADRDAVDAILEAKGISLKAAPFEYPSEYQLPQANKRMRLADGTDITEVHPDIMYPDTDLQYSHGMGIPIHGGDGSSSSTLTDNGDHSSSSSSEGGKAMTAEEYAAYVEQYYASYVADEYAQQTSSSSSSSAQYKNSYEQGQGNEEERKEYDPSSIVASVFKDKTGSGIGIELGSVLMQGIDVNAFVGMDGKGTGTDAIAIHSSDNVNGIDGGITSSTGDGGDAGVVSEDILRRKRFLESMLTGK